MALPDQPEQIARAARICGYVGQTTVIYQRTDGTFYCNYKENRGCDMKTEWCRLREVEEAQRRAEGAPAGGDD